MKKLIHIIFDKKNEKLVLLLLPTLVILIAIAVFIPQIVGIISYIESSNITPKEETFSTAIPSVSSNSLYISPSPSPTINSFQPTPTTKVIEKTAVHLSAVSVERDMHIFVRDKNENIVSGCLFDLRITYPDGSTKSCQTLNDGTCYISNINPGKYKISLVNNNDYLISTDPIDVIVNDVIIFQKIENIEEIVEIKDIQEGLNEIKTSNDPIAQQETTIDFIYSEPEISSNTQQNNMYVLDNNGNITYQYEYHTDENGFLLDRNGQSTDVIPNIENGVLVCGLRFNSDTNSYDTVILFNSDNTPVESFYIIGEPVLKDSNYHSGWQNEGDNLVYYIDNAKITGLKNIDGKLYYFDGNGVRAKTVGCDVSFYNGNIDWNAVKNSGIEFAILRIGFRGWGSAAIYQDTCFEQNLRNAKAAGLKVGVYFYSSAVNKKEAVEEASICIDWMRGQSLDYPIFIDMEFSGEYPSGRADTLSNSSRVEIIQAFCETIKSGGYQPGIYSTQTFLRDEVNLSLLSQYYIWMASFTDNYIVPNVNYRYDMWQFTDNGKLTGINGAVDFNVIK